MYDKDNIALGDTQNESNSMESEGENYQENNFLDECCRFQQKIYIFFFFFIS